MLEQLLAPPVVAVEAFGDDPGDAVFPGEQDLIAKAVVGRRREFVTARRCARDALRALGLPAVPIRTGERREPLWPSGVVGSITHCAGYRAAAVCRAGALASLGVDAEPHAPLPPGVLDSVTTPSDRGRLDALALTHPELHADRLLFSAKESVYKAWYPLTGRWLGFEEADLVIDPDAATFTAHLLVDHPALSVLRGRYLIGRGIVLTAVTVAAAGA
jgi:4'-phosphopantetheinyl transferase EntD